MLIKILLIILAVIVMAAIFAVVIITGKQYKYPKGKRVIGKYKHFKTTLIFGPNTLENYNYSSKQIANALALASWSINEVSEVKTPTHVVTHILNDEDYAKTYDSYASRLHGREIKSVGMLLEVNQKRDYNPLPLVAIKSSKFGSTLETGSLQIHELCHYIIQRAESRPDGDIYDYKHTDPKYWLNQSKTSLESLAQDTYKKHKHEIWNI